MKEDNLLCEPFLDISTVKNALVDLLNKESNNSIDLMVLDILKRLNEITISPKELKHTQLAKIVNNLRKQTTNAAISTESRKLIQRWRSLFVKSSENFNNTVDELESPLDLNSPQVKPTDGSNYAFHAIKNSLNLPDFSIFHVTPAEEPKLDFDLEEFLERDSKRFSSDLPKDRQELWKELEKPTIRSDGSASLQIITYYINYALPHSANKHILYLIHQAETFYQFSTHLKPVKMYNIPLWCCSMADLICKALNNGFLLFR
ncbi:hypothetical protein RF11_05831 [Thelohanellus kitauei]|uniref:TFIIS N-terminal domain-containing protein n=1 Tax=Thelohanellus kitauei TaxID=669202 RepID=A0A0C2IW87_THEKT|nr:hypothetical protein RF11_05831 [Thelohanellus kitauei]